MRDRGNRTALWMVWITSKTGNPPFHHHPVGVKLREVVGRNCTKPGRSRVGAAFLASTAVPAKGVLASSRTQIPLPECGALHMDLKPGIPPHQKRVGQD